MIILSLLPLNFKLECLIFRLDLDLRASAGEKWMSSSFFLDVCFVVPKPSVVLMKSLVSLQHNPLACCNPPTN